MAFDQRRIAGFAKLLRGALAALVAVGSAALGHTAAGHHAPHPLVVLLALCISIPVCVQLSGVMLSRMRLAAAVLSSQILLHGLFALFPASSTGHSALSADSSAHHGEPLILPVREQGVSYEVAVPPSVVEATQDSAHSVASQTDASMIAAHLVAAVFAYALLRGGETLLCGIAERLSITPVLILLRSQPAAHTAPRRITLTSPPENCQDAWPGAGPRSLRGPPALVK
ncbi:hypothetical protein [Nesterenkonia ebinurensis]|uniref:hypothetical protein n=1 Tax=Nesterenkonia ebinurensis TaxID=2608252 RepID=UPI00123D5E0C|nr:hypothetical protein [Nesterenkonia ebinurensis]